MTLLRKPMLFLLVLATGASLAGAGRVSLRLLLDTGVALAPIPLIQMAAFAVVFWTGRRTVGFAKAVDGFFAGSGPWFAAIALAAAFGAVASPIVAAQWFLRVAAVAAVAAIAWSVLLDFAFYRNGLGRTPRRALIDVVVQRAFAWTAVAAYFMAPASPKLGSLIPNAMSMLFGARP